MLQLLVQVLRNGAWSCGTLLSILPLVVPQLHAIWTVQQLTILLLHGEHLKYFIKCPTLPIIIPIMLQEFFCLAAHFEMV